MTKQNLETLKAQIKRHEGLRLKAYQDSLGYWTIGYGHLCGDGKVMPAKAVIDKTEADKMFERDFIDALRIADCYLELSEFTRDETNEIRYAVIINMAFNLGYKIEEFKRLGMAIFAENWGKAADAMLNSKWASQVGIRALELAEQMRRGVWLTMGELGKLYKAQNEKR